MHVTSRIPVLRICTHVHVQAIALNTCSKLSEIEIFMLAFVADW